MPAGPVPELPALFLDSASPVIGATLQLRRTGDVAWEQSTDEAGVGLFTATERLLDRAGISLEAIRSIAFCEGPGSILGIRLAAVAIRTWSALPRPQPLAVFAYGSLQLAAADLLAQGTKPPFQVLADARRRAWNVVTVETDEALGQPTRQNADEPFAGTHPRFHPIGFPVWQPLPEGTMPVEYRPWRVPELAQAHDLLRPVAEPDAFLIAAPTYRTWTPAPGANARP